MRNRFWTTAWILAACVPTLAVAQQPQATDRKGSWEFSLGAGFLFLDSDLRNFVGGQAVDGGRAADFPFANSLSPNRGTATAVARVGYNFTRSAGISVSGGFARGSGVTYLSPAAAFTYTVNLDAKTSPFLLIGTELTRITGNDDRITHSTWGAQAGAGIRHFVSNNVALRLEGRVQFQGYDFDNEPAVRNRSTVYNPVVTLGFSYFTAGRRAPPAPAACPVCPRPLARGVDTVRVYVPFPMPPRPVVELRDTLVLEGVNFAFDESALTPESHEVLDQVARLLQEPRWANVRFEVAGHTSSMGTNQYNMALSQRRAESVRAYLVSRGVRNDRIVARGYGRTQPIFPEEREGDAWQNRRVELRRLP